MITAAGPGRGNYSKEGEGRLERQSRHAEEMRQLYYDFAADPKREDGIRLKAATHLLDRVEGLPVQKVVSATSDPLSLLNDDQLEAERERLRTMIAEHEADRAADGSPPGGAEVTTG